MRNIKLTIEYKGTSFNGWQIQPDPQKTVQGEITKALKKLSGHEVKLIGAGRTDSGVHAFGQVANYKTHSTLALPKIQNALNAMLPRDIAIINTKEVAKDFHSQYSAKSKTYRYSLYLRKVPSPFYDQTTLHFPQKLNIACMRKETRHLIGKKDFRSFMATDPSLGERGKTKNTLRTIQKLNIRKTGPFLWIEIEADGFLYKMVRNIVGTLIEVGTGKRPPEITAHILLQKDRNFAGETAKAHGLTLLEVTY